MSSLGAFLLLAAVVICTPGPDTALTVRNTLAGGRGRGMRTAAGVAAGQAVWTCAASVGVAALIAASRPLFDAVRIAGAAYLVLLGAQSLLAARRGAAVHAATAPSRGGGFRQGLLSNLGNPKMAVFFTSLLPQFAGSSLVGLAGFGAIFSLLTLLWLTGYAVVVARTRAVLTRSAMRRVLDAVTGSVLVAFGVRLARA